MRIPEALPKYLVGIQTMLLMVTASFFTQALETKEGYTRPMFIAYFSTSWLVILGIGQYFYMEWTHRGVRGLAENNDVEGPLVSGTAEGNNDAGALLEGDGFQANAAGPATMPADRAVSPTSTSTSSGERGGEGDVSVDVGAGAINVDMDAGAHERRGKGAGEGGSGAQHGGSSAGGLFATTSRPHARSRPLLPPSYLPPRPLTHAARIRKLIKMPLRAFAMRAIPLAACWVGSNYLLVSSFRFIDVASGLAVEQAAATAFVFIMSVLLLGVPPSYPRIAAVLVCIAGVITIGVAPSTHSSSHDESDGDGDPDGKNPVLGIIFAILAALSSAILMVATKMFLAGLVGLPAVTALLSAVGLSTLTLFWPFLLIANVTGAEDLGFPDTRTGLALLFVISALVVSFNYSLNCGIAISSPLLMRIMTICNIPTSFLVEYIIFGSDVDGIKLLGGGLVLCGFVAFAVVSERERRQILARASGAGGGEGGAAAPSPQVHGSANEVSDDDGSPSSPAVTSETEPAISVGGSPRISAASPPTTPARTPSARGVNEKGPLLSK